MTPTANPAAILSWLQLLHGDSPGRVHICATDLWTGRTFLTDPAGLENAARYAHGLDGREGVYVRVTTLRGELQPGHRGGARDTLALRALWADLDIAGPGHAEANLPPDEDAARTVIAASGLPEPTLWVHSGGGLYPIWLLDEPHVIDAADNQELRDTADVTAGWQRAVDHSAKLFGWHYGRGVGDLARVLRIPGTVNRKAGLARPCRITGGAGQVYTWSDLSAALAGILARITPPPATPASTRPAGPDAGTSPGDDYTAHTDWADILLPAGWTLSHTIGDVGYWTRPGKPSGVSATTNATDTDLLHVFTTSAAPFDGDTNYTKFGAYALLHHGGDHRSAARALAAQGYGDPLTDPADEQYDAVRTILGRDPGDDLRPPAPASPGRPPARPGLDVTNTALAADWLRDHVGRGLLAGYFNRTGELVHAPREGHDGYIPLSGSDVDQDGPAQVRAVTHFQLGSRISYLYRCYRETVDKQGNTKISEALFPTAAARLPVDVPDMLPHLRPLRGVIHAPVLRRDGTILAAPGYDPATALLHLPEPGLTVPAVPDEPTAGQVADARQLLDEMTADFHWVSDHDRANYYGLLLTPLLRELVPPPYKLGAIGAPQPGSGKSLLAAILRIVHGGVFRAEIPDEDAELRKQITSILDVTTGPIVQFDNVTGTLRSSTLAGLLTSARWDDRRLGASTMISRPNDRVWVITGNNLALGGDLLRRALWVTIDPQTPQPHLRTGFRIPNLEFWAREHRGRLVHALLVLARAWVAAGRRTRPRAGDGFARWVEAVDGILSHAGIPGTFDHADAARQDVGADDDEWTEFLRATHQVFGDQQWTVKELLGQVNPNPLIPNGGIPVDTLPADLPTRAARDGVAGLSRSLGKWLRNRDGRWAGDLAVRSVGERDHTKLWQIHTGASI